MLCLAVVTAVAHKFHEGVPEFSSKLRETEEHWLIFKLVTQFSTSLCFEVDSSPTVVRLVRTLPLL